MIFNSFSFLFLFFPLFFLAYLYAPREWGKYIIIGGSVVFYVLGTWRNPLEIAVLAGLTLIGVGACALFQQDRYAKKWLLVLVLVLLAAPLVCLKLAALFVKETPSLPLGLGFYTLQLIAFVIYAYRGGQTKPLAVVEGTLFFPKLISGPVAVPEEIFEDIEAPVRKRNWIDSGLQDFVVGLACKMVIADRLGSVLYEIRGAGFGGVSVLLAWLGVLCFALEIYFDFLGYSRMAIGLGKMLGFLLPENFDHPYCATSVREFWTRFMITVSQWFENYVRIPLANKGGTAWFVIASLVGWLAMGIWFGTGWNFVIWAILMFGLIMGEHFLFGKYLEKYPILGHIYVPIVIGLCWIFFITKTPGEAGTYFLRLIGVTKMTFDPNDWKVVIAKVWPFLACGVIFATPYPQMLWKKIHKSLGAWICLFVLFLICVYLMATAGNDPFLLFSF
ncbi:MAG: MBOAT family protein [Lachnospiraceae bacterium]|nr:MBOAT family protein [Lachnospiraceae bacterium]